VAVVTVAGEMVGVEGIGREIMAASALCRGVGILPARVAIGTFEIGMSTAEIVNGVVYVLTQEGNRNSAKKGGSRRRN
jgi:hypothetical protein